MPLTLIKVFVAFLVIVFLLKILKIVFLPLKLLKWLVLIGIAIVLLTLANEFLGIF